MADKPSTQKSGQRGRPKLPWNVLGALYELHLLQRHDSTCRRQRRMRAGLKMANFWAAVSSELFRPDWYNCTVQMACAIEASTAPAAAHLSDDFAPIQGTASKLSIRQRGLPPPVQTTFLSTTPEQKHLHT
eukprot:6474534-Amphidinium_carterae.2